MRASGHAAQNAKDISSHINRGVQWSNKMSAHARARTLRIFADIRVLHGCTESYSRWHPTHSHASTCWKCFTLLRCVCVWCKLLHAPRAFRSCCVLGGFGDGAGKMDAVRVIYDVRRYGHWGLICAESSWAVSTFGDFEWVAPHNAHPSAQAAAPSLNPLPPSPPHAITNSNS